MMADPANDQSGGKVVHGVLVRQVPVRLLEISVSGCLLETRSQLCVPCSGELILQIDGEPHLDDVRLSRCTRVEGSGSVFRAAAEFLWTRNPGQKSVRRAAQKIQDGAWRVGSDASRVR